MVPKSLSPALASRKKNASGKCQKLSLRSTDDRNGESENPANCIFMSHTISTNFTSDLQIKVVNLNNSYYIHYNNRHPYLSLCVYNQAHTFIVRL